MIRTVKYIDRDSVTPELITDLIDNQTDRCRKPGRQTDIQTVRQLDTKTKREPALQILTCRQRNRQIDGQMDRQTDRQKDNKTDRQISRD